jgi:hypothetical protein
MPIDHLDLAGVRGRQFRWDMRTQYLDNLTGFDGACVARDGLRKTVLGVEQVDNDSIDRLDLAGAVEHLGTVRVFVRADPQAQMGLTDLETMIGRHQMLP